MADYSVIKAASYVLAHTPDMVIHNGTTQTTEVIVNPDSEYLKELPGHLRSYDDCLAYIPNQAYIGNVTNDELRAVEFPYYDKKAENPARSGKYGEIMPQSEFYGLMQICDVFDLVLLGIYPAYLSQDHKNLPTDGHFSLSQNNLPYSTLHLNTLHLHNL